MRCKATHRLFSFKCISRKIPIKKQHRNFDKMVLPFILFFCFCQMVAVDQFLSMFCTVYYDNIIVNYKAWNACAMCFTGFFVRFGGITDFQKVFKFADTFADIDIQVLNVVFGKNLFHYRAARSCVGSVKNDFSHCNCSFQKVNRVVFSLRLLYL